MMSRRQAAGRAGLPGTSDGRFRHILVPTDLTDRTQRALQLAGQLASRDGGRVTLLHVIETIQGLSLEEVKPFYDRLERKVRKLMEALMRRARADAPPAGGVIVRGRRAEEIVKYAAANEVDLIVLASHRVNPSAVDRDWGTISYKVGILAQCPVLLVK
jgi:nucleotide-binding universal stress UspA family protein